MAACRHLDVYKLLAGRLLDVSSIAACCLHSMATVQLNQNQRLAGRLRLCSRCTAGGGQSMAAGQGLGHGHAARGARLLSAEPSAGMATRQHACTALLTWRLVLWIVRVASACTGKASSGLAEQDNSISLMQRAVHGNCRVCIEASVKNMLRSVMEQLSKSNVRRSAVCGMDNCCTADMYAWFCMNRRHTFEGRCGHRA